MNRKIKIILLFIFIFLITGCSGKYEIEIYNGKINESITFNYIRDDLGDLTPFDKTLEIVNTYEVNGDFLSYHKRKNVGKTGIKLINKYESIKEFKDNSKIYDGCYLAKSITEYKNTITLKTTKEFTCLNDIKELDKVEIIVKSNYKVIEHNADKKTGHSYHWYINNDNYKDKPIIIKLDKNKKVFNYNNEVIKRIILIILVVGGTLFIAFISLNLYKNYEIKSNKI